MSALADFLPSTWRKARKILILGIFNRRQLVSAYFFLEMLHTLGTDFVKVTDCFTRNRKRKFLKNSDNLLSKKLLDRLLLPTHLGESQRVIMTLGRWKMGAFTDDVLKFRKVVKF